ncbi:MAG: SRPBCC domain-containing protein [Pseudomonadota bacterium]
MRDTQTKDAQLIKTIYLAATPEKVWDYLTRAEHLAKWYHAAAADLDAGADYQLNNTDGEKIVWGTVLEWEPPKRLVTTFEAGPLGGGETTVAWDLEPLEGGTFVTLTHSGVLAIGDHGPRTLHAIDSGWDGHVGRLRDAVK